MLGRDRGSARPQSGHWQAIRGVYPRCAQHAHNAMGRDRGPAPRPVAQNSFCVQTTPCATVTWACGPILIDPLTCAIAVDAAGADIDNTLAKLGMAEGRAPSAAHFRARRQCGDQMTSTRVDTPLSGRWCQMHNAISQSCDPDKGFSVIEVAEHWQHTQCTQVPGLAGITDESIHLEPRSQQRDKPNCHIPEAYDQYSHRFSIV